MLKGLILVLGFVLLFASVVFVGIGGAALLEVIAFCAMGFSALLLIWIALRNDGVPASPVPGLKIRSRKRSTQARHIARSEPVAR